MGKKDKKKEKKIKGAVKTAAKTEKNALKRMKKEFSTKGEDLDAIIASVQEEERKRNLVTEKLSDPPSPRSGLSLCANSEKDELIFFGGEYFNGNKTVMYNELFIYNTKKYKWLQISSPNGPLPRCSHQAVFVPQFGGQLWVFGGEFSSPTHSQFRHYSDLWVFHFAEKKWEQVKASGGPSSRSGHRMVLSQKKLIVFGGFHESVRDYKYYNDVYAFDLETRKWSKIEAKGNSPSPRSACVISSLHDGGILIYGGYSREKIKRDVDKGTVHIDMYTLKPEKKKEAAEGAANDSDTSAKWKWNLVKQSGSCPSPRCGFSLTTVPPGNRAILFGGVFDVEENEESIQGQFYNDLYSLDLESYKWSQLHLKRLDNPISEEKVKRRRKAKDEQMEEDSDEDETDPKVEDLTIEDKEEVVADDGIFVVKMGPQSTSLEDKTKSDIDVASTSDHCKAFVPYPRMNSCLVAKNGILYLFGGTFEDGDKQITLADFYTLDLKKLDEWKTLVAMDAKTQEWLESDSGSDDDKSDDEESDDNDESDDKKDSDDEMDVDNK